MKTDMYTLVIMVMQWGGHSIGQGSLTGGNTIAVLQQTHSTLLSASISKLESHKDQAYNNQTDMSDIHPCHGVGTAWVRVG